MNQNQKLLWLLLRLSLGWVFLYSGIIKIMNHSWSAAGYLNSSKNFSGFYHWLSQGNMLHVTNLVNEWGQLLLGVSLILGIFVRYSAPAGALLMALYYLVLPFPHTSATAYIVDEHIIYILVLLMFSALQVGRVWGLDAKLGRKT